MQIADALAYLHHRGVVHRDLKAGNCLVSPDNTIRICDFGLARRLKGRFLDTPSRAGTPVYLAPEALLGRPSNEKVDVYSFAVILYEMVSGQQIWSNLSYDDMVDVVVRRNERPDLAAAGSAALGDLISQCWDPTPDARPSFRRILSRLLAMGAKLPRSRNTHSHREVELV